MKSLKLLTIINAVLIFFVYIGSFFIIPEFSELFKGFGAELPLATLFVLKSYKYWVVFLIIPIFIYLKYLTTSRISSITEKNLIVVNISILVFLVLFLPLLVIAMYLPIFEIGK